MMVNLYHIFLLFFLTYTCQRTDITQSPGSRYDQYAGLIKNKSVAIAANHTSIVGDIHLLDYLIIKGIDKRRI